MSKIANIGASTIGTHTGNTLKDRPGRVIVSFKMLMDLDLDIIEDIFKEFIVIEARNNFITGLIEYQGFSKRFDVIKKGELPVVYMIKVDEKKRKASFIRRDDFIKKDKTVN